MSNVLDISFGNIVTATDVRNAVKDTIQHWSDTYLAFLARHDNQDPTTTGGLLPNFASYPDSLDTSRFPEEQLPACVLVVPGITTAPTKHGSGKITANFTVGIAVCVTGQDKSTTIKNAQLYTAAVRLILLQNRSLKGLGSTPFANGVVWMREDYTGNLVRSDDTRTMMAGLLEFVVNVDSVADVSQGPIAPIPNNEPPTGWATVGSPIITITADVIGTEL